MITREVDQTRNWDLIAAYERARDAYKLVPDPEFLRLIFERADKVAQRLREYGDE